METNHRETCGNCRCQSTDFVKFHTGPPYCTKKPHSISFISLLSPRVWSWIWIGQNGPWVRSMPSIPGASETLVSWTVELYVYMGPMCQALLGRWSYETVAPPRNKTRTERSGKIRRRMDGWRMSQSDMWRWPKYERLRMLMEDERWWKHGCSKCFTLVHWFQEYPKRFCFSIILHKAIPTRQ